MAIDPVCGQDIHPKTSQWLCEYRGRAFHFCTSACHDKFIEDPAIYVTHDAHIAGPTLDPLSERAPVDERTTAARVPLL